MIGMYQNNERQYIAANTVNIVPLTNTTGIWAGIPYSDLPCIATIDYSDPTDIKYINTIYGSYNTDTDEFINIDGCPDPDEHGPLVCVGLTSSDNKSVFAVLVSGKLLEYYDEAYRYNQERYYTFQLSGESIYDNIFIVKIEDGVGTLIHKVPLTLEALHLTNAYGPYSNHIYIEDFKYIGNNTHLLKIFVQGSVNEYIYYQLKEPVSNYEGCAASPELVDSLVDTHSTTLSTTQQAGHAKISTTYTHNKGIHSLFTTYFHPYASYGNGAIQPIKFISSVTPSPCDDNYSSSSVNVINRFYFLYYNRRLGCISINENDNTIEYLHSYELPIEYYNSYNKPYPAIVGGYINCTAPFVILSKFTDSTNSMLQVSINKYRYDENIDLTNEADFFTNLGILEIPVDTNSLLFLSQTKATLSTELISTVERGGNIVSGIIKVNHDYNTAIGNYETSCIAFHYNVSESTGSITHIKKIINDPCIWWYENNLFIFDRDNGTCIVYETDGTYTELSIPSLNISSNIVENSYLRYNKEYDIYEICLINRSLSAQTGKVDDVYYETFMEIPRSILSSYNKHSHESTLVPFNFIYDKDYTAWCIIDNKYLINTNTNKIYGNIINKENVAIVEDNKYIMYEFDSDASLDYLIYQLYPYDDEDTLPYIQICKISKTDSNTNGIIADANLLSDIKQKTDNLSELSNQILLQKADSYHASTSASIGVGDEGQYGHVRVTEELVADNYYSDGTVPSTSAVMSYVDNSISSIMGSITPQINTTNTADIDPNQYSIFSQTVESDTEFSISAINSGYKEFTLFITNAGNFNVTLPSTVLFSDGFYPSFTKDGTDVLKFTTINGGTTWFCQQIGQNIH